MFPDQILKTKFLTFEKSDFLIDLKETVSGIKYIEITQTIHSKEGDRQSILKINPKILNTLVAALLEFNDQEEWAKALPKDQFGEDLEKIQSAYLKGISLESLSLQIPKYSVEQMEAMLRGEGIAIVNQNPPYIKKRKFFKRTNRK